MIWRLEKMLKVFILRKFQPMQMKTDLILGLELVESV
jgi:hypothetical protein